MDNRYLSAKLDEIPFTKQLNILSEKKKERKKENLEKTTLLGYIKIESDFSFKINILWHAR